MNLSNRLTFSLVFSVLLIAGFALVPTVMAAEGGPTATFTASVVTLEDDVDTMDVDESTLSNLSGDYILLVNDARDGLAGPNNAGLFEVLVTFNRDVYDSGEADNQEDTSAFGESDLAASDFTVTVYKISDGMEVTSGVTIGTVSRVEIAETDPQEYEKRKFLVEVNVDTGASGDAPLAIRLELTGVDKVFSKATPEGLDNNNEIQLEVSGVGNQASAGNFTVLPKALIRPAVTVSESKIGLHQTVRLTLRFLDAPTGDDRPSRLNIKVTKGSILDDDPDTEGDEGLYPNEDGKLWTLVISPQPGIGLKFDIKVEAIPGAPFILSRQIAVDSTPLSQRIDITGPSDNRGPRGGGPFDVTVTYTVAPADPLTLDGITVTGGTKRNFDKNSANTVYTLTVDPTDPSPGATGTLTVSVGQYSQAFSIPGTEVVVDDTPDDTDTPTVDPNAPTSITLDRGMDARGYLVVAPTGAVTDGAATSGLPSDVMPEIVSLPDLEDILYGGGTIDVYVKKDSDRPDVIVNEVMWAVDENKVGVEGYLTHQWIELYNNSDNAAPPESITLWLKPRAFSGAPSDKGGRTDRLSNVLRFGTTTGWQLSTNHGQNGNSSEAAPKEFISMYRASNKRGGSDGINGANWKKSALLSHVNHRGTPGEENTRSVAPVSTRPSPASFTPPKSDVLINEVYNDSSNDFDWLELRFRKRTNIREWTLSYTRKPSSGSGFYEVRILKFPDRDLWFDAGTILLIVNKDPRDTKLAAGQDYTLSSANQARGAGPHKYWNPSNGNSDSRHYLKIPDYNDGNFLLILRTKDGDDRFGSRSRIHDVVGPGTLEKKTLEDDTVQYEPHTSSSSAGRPKGYIWNTRVWPLNGQNGNDYSLLQNDRKFTVGKVLARKDEKDGWKRDGIEFPNNRGGHGYDRGIVASGTPGYDNSIVKKEHANLANGKVVVSELMLTTDNGRYPQWIELHNTSMTNTVDLQADSDGSGSRDGWSIRVENHRSGSWDGRRRDKLHVEVKFKDLGVKFIPPNQTILITADRVRNSGTSTSNHFPDHRVASIWGTNAKGKFEMESRRDVFLNVEGGFLLEIVDGDNRVSDAVGNLDGRKPDVFNEVGFDDPYSWNWPTDMVGNRRTSLIRKYDDRVPRRGTPDRDVEGSMRGAPAPLGMEVGDGEKGKMYSWVHAADTKMAKAQITWYGSKDDYGTPGHTTSTPLPVSLSYFRPTLENGEVVIRWTTESELDNAGFNILRSDSRNGEFKQVNSELVQGAGTTGERNTYKWVDETAKPGVIYYYQIEDVSFAGERQTLTTTKLKGLISADNKKTLIWGELKEVQ